MPSRHFTRPAAGSTRISWLPTRSVTHRAPPPERAKEADNPTCSLGGRGGAGRAANDRDGHDDDPSAQYDLAQSCSTLPQGCAKWQTPGPDTILLDLFRTNQVRERLIEASLAGLELPPEDYPFYVLIGAEGPWTPTLLAERMKMPLSTVLFRVGRLDQRGHIERIPNPDDRRSYLVSLSPDGQKLLKQARPRFRAFAEAVEERLGQERVDTLRGHLGELRDAIEGELSSA